MRETNLGEARLTDSLGRLRDILTNNNSFKTKEGVMQIVSTLANNQHIMHYMVARDTNLAIHLTHYLDNTIFTNERGEFDQVLQDVNLSDRPANLQFTTTSSRFDQVEWTEKKQGVSTYLKACIDKSNDSAAITESLNECKTKSERKLSDNELAVKAKVGVGLLCASASLAIVFLIGPTLAIVPAAGALVMAASATHTRTKQHTAKETIAEIDFLLREGLGLGHDQEESQISGAEVAPQREYTASFLPSAAQAFTSLTSSIINSSPNASPKNSRIAPTGIEFGF